MAREHGLPESVLRRAEHYLLLDGQDMTAVMDRLNALAAKREGELDALKAEQQRTRENAKPYRSVSSVSVNASSKRCASCPPRS